MKDIITIIIHTHNEKKNIEECLASARLLTETVIVVDMESDDATVSLAQKAGAQIACFPYCQYVEPSRAFGIETAPTPWVFLLDADERMTKELATEIKKAITNDVCTHYQVPRQNIFAGQKWLKHGGWFPDYQIRLIKKSAFIRWPSQIHSPPEIKGSAGRLTAPLRHYFHPNLENMVEKTSVYENIEADLLVQAKVKPSTLTFMRKFLGELYRRLWRNAGFLDGPFGVIESIYQAFSKMITYLFVYEKNRDS